MRLQVQQNCARFGITSEKAAQLIIGLSFDGFKTHLKNFSELVEFANNDVLCAVENRDSSAINQVNNHTHTHSH